MNLPEEILINKNYDNSYTTDNIAYNTTSNKSMQQETDLDKGSLANQDEDQAQKANVKRMERVTQA